MESKKNERANYSLDFKLKVLADMYENGLSIFGAAKKFGIKNHYSVDYWVKTYILSEKSLSLSQETMQKVMDMRKKHELRQAAQAKTPEEKLQEEVNNLRKALQYSELRNEALQELLKIGKEEYGIDLLKKLAPSSRQPPTQTPRTISGFSEWAVWQDTRRLLLC